MSARHAVAIGLALVLAHALGASAPAAAEVVRREAVGVVAATPGDSLGDLRRGAIRADVVEAVVVAATRVAPDADPAAVAEAVRDDPFVYAARYRLLEDRGERPAMLLLGRGAEREYLVMVEAHVDLERLREGLFTAGLMAVPPRLATARLAVAVEGLGRFADYRAVRDGLRAHAPRVDAVEFGRGRVLFAVETDDSAETLLRRLQGSVEGSLVRLSRDPTRLDLRWVTP